MDSKRIQDDEYMLQYYQISVPLVMQHLYNGFVHVIEKIMKCFEEDFTEYNPQKKAICCSVLDNLSREYINNLTDVIEKRQDELRDLLRIPPHVILPEDKYHTKKYSEKKVNTLKDEISQLENLYLKKKAFAYICEKELQILEQLKPLNERVNDIISKLDDLKPPPQTRFKSILENHNSMTTKVMEKLLSDAAEFKFRELKFPKYK